MMAVNIVIIFRIVKYNCQNNFQFFYISICPLNKFKSGTIIDGKCIYPHFGNLFKGSFLNLKCASNLLNTTLYIGEIMAGRIKHWWRNQKMGIKAVIFISCLLALIILILGAVNNFNIQQVQPALSNKTVDNNSDFYNEVNNSSNSLPGNTALDFSTGYDAGYQYGIDEAYTSDPYNIEFLIAMNESDSWKKGYIGGYTQGYNDIKDNKPLQKPKLSNNTYEDPRTGENIK